MIDVDETMPIPGHIYNAYPDSFLLRVSGESMNRCIPDGALRLSTPMRNGSVGKYTLCAWAELMRPSKS